MIGYLMSIKKIDERLSFKSSFERACQVTGLKQKDVAARMGIAPPSISPYANGKKDPGLNFVAKVAAAFGFDLVGFLALPQTKDDQLTSALPLEPMTDAREKELLQQIADLSRRLVQKDDQIERLAARVAQLEGERGIGQAEPDSPRLTAAQNRVRQAIEEGREQLRREKAGVRRPAEKTEISDLSKKN